MCGEAKLLITVQVFRHARHCMKNFPTKFGWAEMFVNAVLDKHLSDPG